MKAGYRTILPCCFCAAIAWSQDTIARPMTERQRKQQEQRLRQELKSGYRKWPDQDVAYIITAAEKSAFLRRAKDVLSRAVQGNPLLKNAYGDVIREAQIGIGDMRQ